MAYVKHTFVLCLVLVALNAVLSSPIAEKQAEHALKRSFSTFLQQDQEFIQAVRNDRQLANVVRSVRARRDAEDGQFDVDMGGEEGGEGKPGFFDRAAKFVMELVQRFLKWINTDDN